jgi:hypothetical protein
VKDSPRDDVRAFCDQVLLANLPEALRVQIGRLHAKQIPRSTLKRLIAAVGGTPFLLLACEAEWDRLEAMRLQGK